MKLTINLDDVLMDRVMKITGASTKTEAIHFALREVARKARLIEVLRDGLGASAEELTSMFDEASDPLALRIAEPTAPYRATKKQRDPKPS